MYDDGNPLAHVIAPSCVPAMGGVMFDFGTGTSNYGLGFDRTSKVHWTFDDDARELVSIQ